MVTSGVNAEAQAADSAVIGRAIQEHQQIRALRRGEEVVFCPHALGVRNGEPWVLGFTMEANGLSPAPGSWVWFRLAELRAVSGQAGVWLTAPRWSRPEVRRFLEDIQVELP